MKKKEVNIIIYVEKDTNIKYKIENYEKKRLLNYIDKINSEFSYPFNIGYIPNTISKNGEKLEAILLINTKLRVGSILKCKVIGVIFLKDIYKILVVPSSDIDINYKNINKLEQLPEMKKKLIDFFIKSNEELNFKNLEYAINLINDQEIKNKFFSRI